MALIKREKNKETNEYWYSVIAKDFKIADKEGKWVKVNLPLLIKSSAVKTSKDGKTKYIRLNEKFLGRYILVTKDKK